MSSTDLWFVELDDSSAAWCLVEMARRRGACSPPTSGPTTTPPVYTHTNLNMGISFVWFILIFNGSETVIFLSGSHLLNLIRIWIWLRLDEFLIKRTLNCEETSNITATCTQQLEGRTNRQAFNVSTPTLYFSKLTIKWKTLFSVFRDLISTRPLVCRFTILYN